MKTRSENEMMSLILDFAEADDRIRATVMNGSRVNPNVEPDIFQDYDIVNFVTDVEPFKAEEYITTHFGESTILQKPEDMIWPAPNGDGSYNYLMQFLDGNRIDLTFCELSKIDESLNDSLAKVLLDKDKVLPQLPPSSERSYWINEPSQQLYQACCNEFLFGLGSHIPKTIWRRELPLLKWYIEVVLREPLVRMFEWEIAIQNDGEVTVGKSGRRLQQHLSPSVWQQYEQTYADAEYENIWKSLFVFHELFANSAKLVGHHYRFQFPEQESGRVLAFLNHVKVLPQTADSIYE